MELLPHEFNGKIKGVISSCAFDKNGLLWLNQYINKGDTSAIYKINKQKKRLDAQETIFVES